MSDRVIKRKILSDKAVKLLSDISNLYDGNRFSSINLTSEDSPRPSTLSEENIVFKTHVTWVVKKCQIEEKPAGKYIDSSSVEVGSPDISYLWFRLYPKGKNTASQSFDFCIHFKYLPEKIYIVCDVALIDDSKNVVVKKTFSGNAAAIKQNTIEFLDFASAKSIRDLLAGKSKEDKLSIQCRIKILSRTYTCVTEKLTHTVKMISEVSNLNNDILKNGNYSDITLLAESREVKAHKFILASESPPLHMLMKLKDSSNSLELDDIKYLQLQNLLKYMYTGKFRILNFADAIDYYIASCNYEVLNLKDLCRAYLIASFTKNNVCYVWDLSRKHQDEYLINACIAFIQTNDVDPEAFRKRFFVR